MANPGGKIPIWLTFGFALGLGFGWFAFRSDTKPVASSASSKPGSRPLPLIPDLPRDRATLGEVEELFMAWGGYCVWKDGLTQFAVWNGVVGRHADFYEVRRSGRRFYFRTLPRADWPLIDHGRLVRCALWFAEPPEVREKFYRDHPEVMPGPPDLIDLPKRPPLLPPLSPHEGESGPASMTPGVGNERLVPPWEAAEPR